MLVQCFVLMSIVFGGASNGLAETIANQKRIEFREFATVQTSSVTLFDLIFKGENVDLNTFKKIKVADTPEVGKEIKFSGSAIAQMISRAKAKEISGAFLKLPKTITVQRQSWKSSLEKAKHDLPIMLKSLCYTECEIVADEIIFPAKKSHYSDSSYFEIEPVKKIPKGGFAFPVTVVDPISTKTEKAWLTGQIRVFQNVPVAKRLLSQGTRLEENDFEIKKVDVTMENDTAPNIERLLHAKLARSINAHQPILNGALIKEKDVVYGQTVTVIVRNESWNVSIEAVAKDAGSIGDRIRVMNPQTRRILNGVLVAKGTVEIR